MASNRPQRRSWRMLTMMAGVAIITLFAGFTPASGAATASKATPHATPPPLPPLPNPKINLATPVHKLFLQVQAAKDHMGWELPQVKNLLPPPPSSIPLLPKAHAPNGAATTTSLSDVRGMDVASYQGNVDWGLAALEGGKFAYVKATEGTYYNNPYFAQQYNGSYNAGMIRGAYAFAVPSYSSGRTQAAYFVGSGGGWSPDGRTLPGMLDIEYNPYGPECYGLSQPAMVGWIADFVNTYHALTGRWAAIYSTYKWWNDCTGNSPAFANNDPLDIANYASNAGPLPAGWPYYTFWQYADSGTYPGDQDVFNGSQANLVTLARNG